VYLSSEGNRHAILILFKTEYEHWIPTFVQIIRHKLTFRCLKFNGLTIQRMMNEKFEKEGLSTIRDSFTYRNLYGKQVGLHPPPPPPPLLHKGKQNNKN